VHVVSDTATTPHSTCRQRFCRSMENAFIRAGPSPGRDGPSNAQVFPDRAPRSGKGRHVHKRRAAAFSPLVQQGDGSHGRGGDPNGGSVTAAPVQALLGLPGCELPRMKAQKDHGIRFFGREFDADLHGVKLRKRSIELGQASSALHRPHFRTHKTSADQHVGTQFSCVARDASCLTAVNRADRRKKVHAQSTRCWLTPARRALSNKLTTWAATEDAAAT